MLEAVEVQVVLVVVVVGTVVMVVPVVVEVVVVAAGAVFIYHRSRVCMYAGSSQHTSRVGAWHHFN